MKHFSAKRVLSAGILFGLFFFFGISPALSEEKAKKFFIPPSLQKGSPLKQKLIKPPSIKYGEEIPDWVARLELARVLSYVKQYDESVSEYEKLLKEKPDLVDAKLELAKVLFWKGDAKTAFHMLQQIPEKNITGDTRVLMADLYMTQQNYKKAEQLYRAHLETNRDDHAVRLKLAEMLSWEKEYDASLAEYRKILEALPDETQVRRRYAFVLIWSGKHAEAATELKKTLNQ
ncbi:MAG: tetratricopeptide repeat protein [Desulfobacteraceae bacterium]|nr:tetratricopeptide repeat protein [Desulfobacteraceae bacterium]